jgi:serine/threonine-protein kinase
MLTGRVPFEGEQSLAVAIAHVREMPTPPRLFNQSIHPEVENLVLRCLEKDPNHRYHDMDELGRELRRLAALPSLDGNTLAPAADEFTAVMSSDAMQKRLAEEAGVATTAGGASSMPASTPWEQRARYEYEPAPAATPLPTTPPAPTGRANPATQHPYGTQQASGAAPGVPAGRGAVTVFEAPRRSLLLPFVGLLLLLALGGVGVVALLNPTLMQEARALIGLAGPAPTATPTPVATPVPTVVAIAPPTAVPTATPVATATATPAPTATATPTPSPTPEPPTRDRAAEAAIEERFNRHAAGLAELNLSYDDLKDHPSVQLALRILQEGRERMPESPRVQHLLGTFYITLGRFDEAREVLQLLSNNPLADPAERDFAERLVFTLTPND